MLPPVPDEPVRPPPVAIAGEVALRIGVREGVELDARLAVPEGARRVVVVAHPHPLYGGTMHNAVVVAIVKAAAARGMATLRFDFRGVGASSGQFDDTVGETDDVAAALAEAARRVPRARLALAGYSFGSACALRVVLGLSSIAHPMPARVALVAPSPRLFRLET
ncbi:MAG: alpha/beta hydrolase, partial [Deltaproteobacteria bacterium]|nr:alpha/beta hydrolase [Deltaproteobacteria bacterium]